MALAIKQAKQISYKEYIEQEKKADFKSEYFAGEIFMMAGGSPNHNRIVSNVNAELNVGLRGSRCEAFNSDQRVRVKPNGLGTYPDSMVVCGQIKLDEIDKQAITNPIVLIEVLSPSTKDYDQGGKFELYREIESFRDYVTIHQDQVYVQYWHKGDDGRWILTETRDLNATIHLESINFDLPLRRLYERVDWLHEGDV